MTDPNGALIKLEGVTKVFYTDEVETHALDQVHLEIREGEYSPSAARRGAARPRSSRSLDCWTHRLAATTPAGQGESIAKLSSADRARIRNRQIGFIFQAFNLIGDLTVAENVELPLTYRGMPAADRRERVHRALERVGMAHRTKHYPAQLSGGQQQRVAVARAVGGDPVILLADEPTGNLDSQNGEAVMGLFRELHQERRDDLHGHPRRASPTTPSVPFIYLTGESSTRLSATFLGPRPVCIAPPQEGELDVRQKHPAAKALSLLPGLRSSQEMGG